MSKIYSYDVGNGDMFCIRHERDYVTVIDCCIPAEGDDIINNIKGLCRKNDRTRLIITHPEKDHYKGIARLTKALNFEKFCFSCAPFDEKAENEDQKIYTSLKNAANSIDCVCGDGSIFSEPANYASGIRFLWPRIDSCVYKAEMAKGEENKSKNCFCPVIVYSLKGGVVALWMGDLEEDFLKKIANEVEWPTVDIMFAPHHGRDRIPATILKETAPKLIVNGIASGQQHPKYPSGNSLSQSYAKNILFEGKDGKVHVYVSGTVNELAKDLLKKREEVKNLKINVGAVELSYVGSFVTHRGESNEDAE